MVTELTNLEHLALYLSSLLPFTFPLVHVLAPDRRKARRNRNWTDASRVPRTRLFCLSGAVCLLLPLSAALAHGQSTGTPVLTAPAPGSVLSGSSVTFTWTTDKWASTYELFLGTSFNAHNLGQFTVSPSKNATVSVNVTGLPMNGAEVYAILSWTSSNVKHYKNYSYTAATKSSIPTLSIDSSSISFGQVTLKDASTQSLTLKSTGTASVTVSSATVSGTGFSASGISFPKTLSPGQSATLEVEFDPTVAGAATGKLVVDSNSSSGSSKTIALSGTGVAVSGYQVNLSWDAPGSGAKIAGYSVYRATGGSSAYQKLNASPDAGTSYADATVKDGTTYDYYVESVSTAGASSAPSGVLSIAVP